MMVDLSKQSTTWKSVLSQANHLWQANSKSNHSFCRIVNLMMQLLTPLLGQAPHLITLPKSRKKRRCDSWHRIWISATQNTIVKNIIPKASLFECDQIIENQWRMLLWESVGMHRHLAAWSCCFHTWEAEKKWNQSTIYDGGPGKWQRPGNLCVSQPSYLWLANAKSNHMFRRTANLKMQLLKPPF